MEIFQDNDNSEVSSIMNKTKLDASILKTKRRGNSQNYFEVVSFTDEQEYLQWYEENVSHWSFKNQHLQKTTGMQYTYYYCCFSKRKKGYNCKTKLRIIKSPKEANTETSKIYIIEQNDIEHDHAQIELSCEMQNINNYVNEEELKKFIIWQLKDGLTPKEIHHLMEQENFAVMPSIEEIENIQAILTSSTNKSATVKRKSSRILKRKFSNKDKGLNLSGLTQAKFSTHQKHLFQHCENPNDYIYAPNQNEQNDDIDDKTSHHQINTIKVEPPQLMSPDPTQNGLSSVYDQQRVEEEMCPELFVELMAQFYRIGWVMGSSGGMAAVDKRRGLTYHSPSSVQKERLCESDLFAYKDGVLVGQPLDKNLKESACSPLFKLILEKSGCDCVIHTHSKYSNLLTQLLPYKIFEISNQEMLKGIWNAKTRTNYANTDRLVVQIVENAPQEYQLLPSLRLVLEEHPESSAILVRNHGLFVWGPTWQKTKIMLECYEYLCELACEMIKYHLPLVK